MEKVDKSVQVAIDALYPAVMEVWVKSVFRTLLNRLYTAGETVRSSLAWHFDAKGMSYTIVFGSY